MFNATKLMFYDYCLSFADLQTAMKKSYCLQFGAKTYNAINIGLKLQFSAKNALYHFYYLFAVAVF